MNCKWAEGQLSASLDGTLDPAVREEVEAHVESCANCSSILAEFRYFDGLLRELPRYEPADTLRERIFDSPEFAAIVRSLDGSGASRPATRWPILSRPSSIARPTRGDDAGRRGHDRPLDPLPFPTPPAEQDPPATPGAPTGAPRHGPGGAPPWVRVAVSAAAAVVIVVGSALLIKQGLSHSTTAHTPGISSVAEHQPGPLAAGARVVFLRDGALWSAPEQGTAAQQLTPTAVVVAPGWTVAPLHDGSGGDRVAYIDLKTGALHVVRSDDQRDHVVVQRLVARPGSATWAGAEGQAILNGLAWSPDGTQLAYLSDPTATGQATLGVVRADGGSPAVTMSAAGATASSAVWSPDGQRLAFVQTDAAGQRSVWDANVGAQQLRRLGAAGRDASAVVRSLAWLPATSGPIVTWASVDPASGSVTGLFVDQILQDSEARPVTASGLVFSAAAFSPARLGGTWLLGDGTSVYEVSPTVPGLAQLFSVSSGVSSITWSSDGSMAAILSTNGDLRVWTQATHAPLVANGVSQQVPVAWAPDGSALAFVAGGQVSIIRIQGGEAGSVTTVAGLVNVTAVAWAPDSQRLAVATVRGVASVTADGASSAQVDGHSATGALIWSVAR